MKRFSLASSRWATTSVALALVLLSLDPRIACAQEPAPPAPSTVLVPRDGVAGVWMPMTTYRRIGADLEAYRLQVPDLERLLALERAQSVDLRAQLDSYAESERVAAGALAHATAHNTRLVERVARLKRLRPWFYVAGVLSGVLVVVVPVALTR
jgi:hypothetical protein